MKALQLTCLVVAVLLLAVSPAVAYVEKNVVKDEEGKEKTVEKAGPDHVLFSGAAVGAAIGAGLTIIGAGIGFGRVGASALEGMARQPEVAGTIQTAMIIIAAMLEGATFFSLIVCIVVNGKATW